MPFVMVPVPTEHEAEFGQWLLGLTLRAKLASWPAGAIRRVVDHADAEGRTILELVARGTDLWAPAAEAAAQLGLEEADLVARVEALNAYCYEQSLPAVVMVRAEGQGDPGAGRALLMAGPVRTEVLSALAG